MSAIIKTLGPNQVFIMGTNSDGFSFRGSAGTAIRGYENATQVKWYEDPWCKRAMEAPVGHIDRIGKWGVFGVARGFSRGHEGMSYAIETVKHRGDKRSTPLRVIEDQLVEMMLFADAHPGWEFLMTAIGSRLAGWTEDEMAFTLAAALGGYEQRTQRRRPANLVIPQNLYGYRWDAEITSEPRLGPETA